MPSIPSDARVLVVRSEDDVADQSAVASSLTARLSGQTVVRCGPTAAEYLLELGPTVDCVVSLCGDTEAVRAVERTDSTIPLVVYGDGPDGSHVDAVVPTAAGVDGLVEQIRAQVAHSREESHLEEVNAKLTALGRYAKEITGCETVQDVCDQTIEATLDALAFDFCVLALVEGDRIVPYGSTLPTKAQRPIGIDQGIAGRTLEAGEPQVVADMQTDPDATFKERGFRSVVSVPIGDRGTLQVVSREVGAYEERDVEFLEILAGYTNEALARLEREAALRAERDRFHTLFDGLPGPAVYVESEEPGGARVREVNAAYETLFPDGTEAVGAPASEALPTARERALVLDHLRDDGPARERVERTLRDGGTSSVSLTLVPVEHVGQAASGFLVYVLDGEGLDVPRVEETS
jgi:PAS domain-containing protein